MGSHQLLNLLRVLALQLPLLVPVSRTRCLQLQPSIGKIWLGLGLGLVLVLGPKLLLCFLYSCMCSCKRRCELLNLPAQCLLSRLALASSGHKL